MIKKTTITSMDDTSLDVGGSILDMLRQIFYKLSRMTFTSIDALRVYVEGGYVSDARNYPRFTPETSNELIAYKGQQYTNIRWQQQREFITDN